MSNTPLMSTRDLSVHYPLRGGGLFGPKPVVRAVEGVNIDINKGNFFGVVILDKPFWPDESQEL